MRNFLAMFEGISSQSAFRKVSLKILFWGGKLVKKFENK